MANQKQTFEERKETALRAAMAQGIIDVVHASPVDGISIDTLELATKLTKKHAPALCRELEARRNAQK